ncbi:hypothetical protein [Streptomyces sp. CNQ085]|uniref:hypothetical protein n=1 Tax=Streptomyces sp. CNQ085 TaxID=2886944 RepID=UPI0027E4D458|nr:hypothetical protein [Streptomyces sp. CNQ085]
MVVLALLLVLAVLAVWAVRSGGPGGDGGSDQGGKRGGGEVPGTITPGPSSSKSLISQRPGGREESGVGSDGSGGPGGDGGAGPGDGGADGEGEGGANGSGSGGPGAGGAGGSSGVVPGGIEAVPADSTLPDCRPGSVEVTLRSDENRYAPGEEPVFRLTVRNEGGGACKVDFGTGATTLTIVETEDGDEKIWKSEHCPKGARSALYKVPVGGTAVRTLEWDRRHSTPGCGTPGAEAEAGTYLVEAEVEGLEKKRTTFVLAKD